MSKWAAAFGFAVLWALAGHAQLPFDDVSLPLVYTKTGGPNSIVRTKIDPFSETAVLTSNAITETAEPSMNSEDGRILFSAADLDTGTPVIWMRQPKTGTTAQVTQDTGDFQGEFSPVWHPSGTRFFFVRKISNSVSVLVMRHGKGLAKETIIPATVVDQHRKILHPDVSPDGKLVAYVSQEVSGDFRIYTVDLSDLGASRTLVQDKGLVPIDHPTFSPLGNWIMYVRRGGTPASTLRVTNLEGSFDGAVTTLNANVVNGLEWSRDDSLVAISAISVDGTTSTVGVMPPTGGAIVPIAASTTFTYTGVTWGQGFPRLFVKVLDAETGLPIPGANVIARPENTKAGFELQYVDDGLLIQRYESAPVSPGRYIVSAAAAGYLVETMESVPALPGIPQEVTIALLPNPVPTALGQLDIVVPIFDGVDNDTLSRLVLDSITISVGGDTVEPAVVFFAGGVRVYQVPRGIVTINIATNGDYVVEERVLFLGLGERKRISMPARRAGDRPPRATIPGQIVGTVSNIGFDPAQPVANGSVYCTNESGLTYFTRATSDGVYFFPDIEPGINTLQAFTADNTHSSDTLETSIVSGQIYGDEVDEDTALEIIGAGYDSDGDGMDDGFEDGNGLDPLGAEGEDGAEGDPDVDGAQNLQEYLSGTDPLTLDSDGDGWTDGQEIAAGTNPLDGASVPGELGEVWVDFGYELNDGIGTVDRPFQASAEAFLRASIGANVRIKGDVSVTSSAERGIVFETPVTITAENGAVRIGTP